MGSDLAHVKLGELIQCYRNRESMTQQDFAKEAGVAYESVVAIEKGEMPLEHAVLKSILTVLHIPMAEIVAYLSTEEVSTELWLSLLELSLPSQDRQLSVDILVHVLAYCDEECEDLDRFYENIEMAKLGIDEDSSGSTYKVYSTLLICSSYFRLEEYDQAEKYLKIFSQFPFSFVQEHADFLTTKLYEKRGDIDLAIRQLQKCLKVSSSKICIVNALLRLYLSQNDSTSAKQLLQQEQEYLDVDYLNPNSITGHAHCFLNKGKWLHQWGKNSEAVDCYIRSVRMFVELTAAEEALLRKMEWTRLNMMSLAKTGRNLTDTSVVQLSQELDTYIVEIQKKGILKSSLLRN